MTGGNYLTRLCQICGSDDLTDFVNHAEGHYLRCRNCGLIFNADAEQFAQEAADHHNDPSYFAGYERRFAKKVRSARRRLDVVQSYTRTGKLVDVGCGVGDTLVAARDAGFEAVGVDVGDHPVQHCRQLGFEVHQASVTDTGLGDDSVDVVTMWDVLEHIPRTIDGLHEVHRILKAGGITAIRVPSGEYLRARLSRNTYRAFRGVWAQTHYVYHTRHTLARLLVKCQLEALRPPLFRKGAWSRRALSALVDSLIAVPRYVLNAIHSGCRLSRNLFVIARKHPRQPPLYQIE